MSDDARPVRWVGACLRALREFPEDARREVGYALHLAQAGGKPQNAKPLKSFVGAAVLEIVVDHDTDTYRTVYTVRFEEAIYVLHAFQKKSKTGKATPQQDIDLIRRRYKLAEDEHRKWQKSQREKK